jgi:hypothetical protein
MNPGNYVDDSITEEELALFLVEDDAPVFSNSQIALGYTGISNQHNTCYFNALMQLLAKAYRQITKTGRVHLEYSISEEKSSACTLHGADNWGPKLLRALEILVNGSSAIVIIDDLVKEMSHYIHHPDFVYGRQCDPVFLCPYLTEFFDYHFPAGQCLLIFSILYFK